MTDDDRSAALATAVGSAAKALDIRVDCAESRTSGRVASALGAAPDSSVGFREPSWPTTVR
ncbi:hypothetical protein ACOCJ4_15455 [Knoellia sp. CPCC 206435]|uniref:hypothetical protein n=1 Tax=Knoellia terrae TaxID=3404797 RepID=UPI003B42DF01